MTTILDPHHAADLTAQAARRDVDSMEALRARDVEDRRLGLKLSEVAAMLGISRRHLYSQAVKGFVPSYRIGKALRFSPVALREWVAVESAASLLQPVDPPAEPVCSQWDPFEEEPVPKIVHVRRGGEWVTQLPVTVTE